MVKHNRLDEARKIDKILTYAERHPDWDAIARGRKAEAKYRASIISETIAPDGTSKIRTTGLNLDIEQLLKDWQNSHSEKENQ